MALLGWAFSLGLVVGAVLRLAHFSSPVRFGVVSVLFVGAAAVLWRIHFIKFDVTDPAWAGPTFLMSGVLALGASTVGLIGCLIGMAAAWLTIRS